MVLVSGHIVVQVFPPALNYLALIPARYCILESFQVESLYLDLIVVF